MPKLSFDRWQTLSPYLDKALALSDNERDIWLASLRFKNSALVDQLDMLLKQHRALSKERFLEYRPAESTATHSLAGQTLGVYKLISQIGQGGMGSVWQAERNDGRFERRVAVKFLNIALMGKSVEARFKREGKILARLTHPHIAELLDAGLSQVGQPYLVLEHVEGDHIDRYCDQKKLSVEARIRLFLDVLEAVAQAHANLIVHRDLKPSNVLVRKDGQTKLVDFGIAKLMRSDESNAEATQLTAEGYQAVTPAYASPEQLKGETVTTATDIYALGVLLYVLLTGQHPAGSGPYTPATLIKTIVDQDPKNPSDVVTSNPANAQIAAKNAASRSTTPERLRRSLRGDLDTIIAKALKKEPSQRYVSVTAFADDLRRYLANEPIGARPDALAYCVAKFIRRNRGTVALATLAIVATAAGIAGTWMQARKARGQRDFALRQLARAESINDLDNFLLADAAPSGKPFTVTELLGRAEHIVDRQNKASLADRVELLTSIGHKYVGQDEDGKARPLLERAYQISRELSDPSLRAQASCALGSALARSDLPRAEALVQEGLRELPHEPQFTLDRISCLSSASAVARENGDSREAITRSLTARDLLVSSPLRSEITDLHVQMALAESYRTAGQYRNALPAFEQAASLMTALGRDDTETAGTLFNNWALALDLSGRPLEAERLFRRAIDISRADQAEREVSPMLLTNYSRTLFELGRTDEAARYADEAYAKARQSGNEVVINQSLLTRARILRAQGELAQSEAMLSEVEPRLRKALPPGHLAFTTLDTQRALLAVAYGDLQSALRLDNHAFSIADASIKAGQGGADYLQCLLVARSDVERQLGNVDTAVTDAAQGVALMLKDIPAGTHSYYLGHAYYILGRALQARSKHEEAMAAFRSASENLQETVGANHAETRAAQQMMELETKRR